MSRRDARRLDDISDAILAIRHHLGRGGLDDGLVYDAVRVRLIEIGEAVKDIAPDPDNAKAVLWNPAGASFEDACARLGVRDGTAAIIGGPVVFGMFLDRYDTFWLSEAPHVKLPGGEAGFPGVPENTPQAILAAHGLQPREVKILDAANDVRVTAWRRAV